MSSNDISSPPDGLTEVRIPLSSYKLGPVSSMNIIPSLSLELAGVRLLGSVAQIPVQPSAIAMNTLPSLSMCKSLKSSRFLFEPPWSLLQSPLFRQMAPTCTGSVVSLLVWNTGSSSRAFKLNVTYRW